MICLSIVLVGLAIFRENASFSPYLCNLFIEWASLDRNSGDLSTFHPFDCFPVHRRLPVTINF
jgi:hypothetical protein